MKTQHLYFIGKVIKAAHITVPAYENSSEGWRKQNRVFRKTEAPDAPCAIVGMKYIPEGQKVYIDDSIGFVFETTGKKRLFYLVRYGWLNKEKLVADEDVIANVYPSWTVIPFFFQEISSHEKQLRSEQTERQKRDKNGRFR